MKIASRLAGLRQKFAEKEIDALLISQPENRYYISGFDGSDGYVLITSSKAIVATDSRYTEQARQQCPDYSVFFVQGKMEDWFPRLADGLGLRRLGFESAHVTIAFHQQLGKIIRDKRLPFELVPVENLVEPLRMVKSDEEIALIQAAVDISDRAMAHIRDVARPGMTELEAAWEIEKFMREAGSQAVPFEGIVGTGPNAALPHHKPCDRPLQAGESIVIDIGARVGHYASDLTRTICLGKADDKIRKVYGTVLEAQQTALDGIRAGMTGEQADALARDVIVKAGFGENFGHGLGHGVGLAVHEWPRVSVRGTDVLADGMVFSVEPGIYIVDYGGVRIEDLVVMRGGKVVSLSNANKVFEV